MDLELICIGLFAFCGCVFFILFLAWFRGGQLEHAEGKAEGDGNQSAAEDQSSMIMSSGAIDHAGNLNLSSLASHSSNYFMKRLSRSLTAERSAFIMPSVVREFSLEQIEAATRKFSTSNMIKQGHSGDIYRGALENGEVVVIKRIHLRSCADKDLSYGSFDGLRRDFYSAEMDIYGKVLDQSFLVPVIGQCLASEAEKFLVYAYMPYGDLASAIAKRRAYRDKFKSSVKMAHGEQDEEGCIKIKQPDGFFEAVCRLTWPLRMMIVREVAQALVYLHHESRPPLSHRNIQGSSILLNKDLEVKLGSLGDALKIESGELPAYDIYCFGRLLLDIISGLDISGMRRTRDEVAQTWIGKCFTAISSTGGRASRHILLEQLVDDDLLLPEQPAMDKDLLLQEISQVAQLAKLCMQPTTLQNLTMKVVLHLLPSHTSQ